MTKYARDEFDKVPETASRQGVHRTASAPSRARLWPILAAGIFALAIGAVSFLILPKLGFSGPATQASSSMEAAPLADTGSAPSVSPDTSPTPSTDAEPSASSGQGAGTGTGDAPSSAPTERTAPVDKTRAVAVYNAAGIAGLASRVGGTVQSDGWTLGQVGNWAGAPQQGSIIFYSGATQLANVQALAELLGVTTMVESTEFQVPLVVVLGPGYR